MLKHKAPWGCIFPKEIKSLCLPGDKPKSDQEYFEILSLCVLQAGLNWRFVRRNWDKIKQTFFEFDIDKLAKTSTKQLLDKSIIKNRRKIKAIVNNAKKFKSIIKEYGSFENFLNISKDLKSEIRKFEHIGDYSTEYFLHSIHK